MVAILPAADDVKTPRLIEVPDIPGLEWSLPIGLTPVAGTDHRPVHCDGLDRPLSAGRQVDTIERQRSAPRRVRR